MKGLKKPSPAPRGTVLVQMSNDAAAAGVWAEFFELMRRRTEAMKEYKVIVEIIKQKHESRKRQEKARQQLSSDIAFMNADELDYSPTL